jgi:hypothetical protein
MATTIHVCVCLWDGTFLNRWLDSSQTGVCCASRQNLLKFYYFRDLTYFMRSRGR